MTCKEMERTSKTYADDSITCEPWGEEERDMRWSQLYHSKMSALCADEAKRMRGDK